MKRLTGLASRDEIQAAISDLERLRSDSPVISVAAIHVLKNELEPLGPEAPSRRLLYQADFALPRGEDRAWSKGVGRGFRRAVDRLRGRGAESFRDDCDRFFWDRMVPEVTSGLGALAEPFLNTINEVIINYAEYSFEPWALFRSVSVQVFMTEGPLAFGIVRPRGLGQRVFDPLSLKEKRADTLRDMRRGWGHTLLMRRALFISFDHSPKRRGMMTVVGPED